MIKSKMIFAVFAVFLFLAVAMIPASAQNVNNISEDKEYKTVNAVLNKLFDNIETVENEAQLINLINDCFTNELLESTPVLRDIFVKLIQWVLSSRGFPFGNNILGNLFGENARNIFSKDKFIISFGSYTKKFSRIAADDKPTLYKRGFAFFRYSDAARLFKGRTLIAERHPFRIDQRVQGSQIGILFGFNGLFIDVESKLTGNSYVFIMGNARRAKAFNFALFSK
jgi:hypothetical protein